MSFNRLQGCWLVGWLVACLLACLLTWWDGGLFDWVCMLFVPAVTASLSELFGRLVVGMIGLLIG